MGIGCVVHGIILDAAAPDRYRIPDKTESGARYQGHDGTRNDGLSIANRR